MQTIHQLVDEAETEVARDVDLIGKRLAMQKANPNIEAKHVKDEEQTVFDSDNMTICGNGQVISGLPKPGSKYQNMRLRVVDQNKNELFFKLQHYAQTLPTFLQIFSKIDFRTYRPPPKKKGPPKTGEKREVPQIAHIQFKRLFEISGINQTENKFDRLLSECANATGILGSAFKTAIVQLHGLKEIAQKENYPQQGVAQPQIHYGNVTGQVLFEIQQTCRFAHLFHQNLMFTDQSIFQLLPNSQVKELHKFDPPLTALCRVS